MLRECGRFGPPQTRRASLPHSTARRRTRQIETLRTQFALADGGPFADLLTAERLEQALRQEQATWREALWTPLLTLGAFLSQVTSPDGSCRLTVNRVLAWLVSRSEQPCTPKTDPYGKARQRLPESLLRRLLRETDQSLHELSPAAWRWKNRRVQIADGTTVSMPDPPKNQAAYSQPDSPKPGLGFPIARLVAVFCLATGTVVDAALGRSQGKQQGQNSLLRTLEEALEAGDVLLADRYYSGWFDLAWWQQRGVEVVTRLPQRRRCDRRRGRRLGRNDPVVVGAQPPRPDWMDEATSHRLPEQWELREVRIRVVQPGCRTTVLVVGTTLLDAVVYAAAELAQLYRLRWQAELDRRALKGTLGRDVLRCKSPTLVRKEVWAHLLAYKPIRGGRAQAAEELGCEPRELRFTGALQALTTFAERLLEADEETFAE
ncbi:MAG TPA: IS4 family transposase [Gemmataceae bacterium]|nr:IS4 family transposase [Gemmataceae bacterium]